MYIKGDKMNIRMLLVPLLGILLFAGCNLFSTPDREHGQMLYYAADSTGTERCSFKINEPIFVHFKMINPTNRDIFYKKYPYMADSALFSYGVYTPGTDGDDVIGYPPQDLQETFLPQHESREQVCKIEGLEGNEYRIKLQLLIFVNPNDFQGNFNPYLHIKVGE